MIKRLAVLAGIQRYFRRNVEMCVFDRIKCFHWQSRILSTWLMIFISCCGCEVYSHRPISAPKYHYLNPEKDIRELDVVVMAELINETTYPRVSQDVSEALLQAVQKKQLFRVMLVRNSEPEWQSLTPDEQRTYTFDELARIHDTFNCDAILVGAVTHYQPYPHASIGLRLKLIDLRDAAVVWAIEQTWDSSDEVVGKRVREYLEACKRSDFKRLHEHLITVSPLEFLKFVVYQTAKTLDQTDM